MATIASLNVALSADSARLKRDLDKANKSTKTWAQKQKAHAKSVSNGFKSMGAAMAGIAAVMGVNKLLDNADALGKNAKAAGLSVEAYQRLQHGFAQAGISQSGFEKGQKTLNKIFADAGDGLAGAQDVLESIGLTYEDLAAMAPEERMLAVARSLESIEDAGLRSAYATELMGKEMGKVTLDADQIIADGEGIAVVNEDAALKAAAMNDTMNRLGTTMTNLATNVIVPLVAEIVPLIESIGQFAQDNPTMAAALAGLAALGVVIAVAGGPITAIALAIAGAILVFQNWEEIIGFLSTKWTEFGDKFPLVSGIITKAIDVLKAPFVMIKDVIGAVFELFSGEGSFLDRLKAFGGNIVSALVTNNPVVQLMENLAGVLKAPLNAVIGLFEGMVNRVIEAINEITKFEIKSFGKVLYSSEGLNLQPVDLPTFAKGGHVSGKGSGTSDDIQAMLSNGEFVVTAAATAKYGTILEAMNNGSFKMVNSGNSGGDGTPEGGESGSSIGEGLLDSIQASFATAMQDGDWKGFLESTMDSFTSTVIDNFAEGLFSPLDDFLGGAIDALMASLNGGDGGGGIWGSLGTIFGAFGAADGGIVPTTPFSKSYADSVPTMLQPGELVVPKDQVGNFMNGGSGGGQTFNINVTGDVSRATRREIVAMMPQIANGTNALNKENGIR